MDVEIRTIEPADFDAFIAVFEHAFSGSSKPDEVENDRKITEFDRTFVAIDGDEMVGGALGASYTIAVPGGREIPACDVVGVRVKPSHRRRGINTALIRRQLDEIRERGRESIAALHASEGGIYGRFGYGLASFAGGFEIEAARSAFVRGFRGAGRVRLLSRDDALPLIRSVYDAGWDARPGGVRLDDRWFGWLHFVSERDKGKDDGPFWAVHVSERGEPDAYAVYKVKHEWPDEVPTLELSVESFMSASPQAEADMWRYLFDVDLVNVVKAWNRPVDDPLLHLLQEPRRLRLKVRDGMWLRPVDLPRALSERGYAADGRVVFDVRDAFCPWNEGRWELVVGGGEATCRATDSHPDIACSVNALGSSYLGGSSFRTLARALQVEELAAGALSRADSMFASEPAPWCAFMF